MYLYFNGTHIVRLIYSSGEVSLLKKTSVSDKKERLVKVPKSTMDLLVRLMEVREVSSGFVFTQEGKPIKKKEVKDRFTAAIKNAEIGTEGSKIVPYSLSEQRTR